MTRETTIGLSEVVERTLRKSGIVVVGVRERRSIVQAGILGEVV